MIGTNTLIGKQLNGEYYFLSKSKENNGILIGGGSGGGKTNTALTIICNKENYHGKIITFNWHRCLDRDTLMPNVRDRYNSLAKVIDVKREGLGIPLFNKMVDKDGNVETNEDVVDRIVHIFKAACNMKKTHSIAQKFKDAVEAIIETNEYQKIGAICFCDWLKKVDTAMADKALSRIEPLCKYIHDGNFLDCNEKIIELDLNGLYLNDQKFVVEFILEYVCGLGFTGVLMDSGITLYIDEAQGLNYDNEAPICRILNEGRKVGIDVMLVVQSIQNRNIRGFEVIRQCATKLFFKPIAGEERYIANMIEEKRKVDAAVVTLKDLSKGQFLAHGYFKSSPNEETQDELAYNKKVAKVLMYPEIAITTLAGNILQFKEDENV